MTGHQDSRTDAIQERRTQPRVEARIEVRLTPEIASGSIGVQNLDLSWGGVRLLLPETPLAVGESVKLEFPWTPGRSFYARADVVRSERVSEGFVTGLRFSKLLVRHESRLERLLGLLMGPGRHETPGASLSPQIDLDFMDVQGIISALEEIHGGRYQITSFRPYGVNQSLMLAFIWQGRVTLLRLRARVRELRRVELKRANLSPSAAALAQPLFRMDLSFEHPLADLRRAIDPLMERLRERNYWLRTAA